MGLLTLEDIWDDMSLKQQEAIPRIMCRVIKSGYFDLDHLYTADRQIYRQMSGVQRRLVDWMIGETLKSVKEEDQTNE